MYLFVPRYPRKSIFPCQPSSNTTAVCLVEWAHHLITTSEVILKHAGVNNKL